MRAIALSIFWWTVTVLTLVLLDDLLFGPVFWAIAVWNRPAATIIAFLVSMIVQIWLVRAGTKEVPGKAASFMLKRLMLDRKNKEIEKRDQEIKAKSAKIGGAIMISPLIGGVLPVLLLHKHQFSRATVLKVAWVTIPIYAIEFMAIHGGYGLGHIANMLFR